MSKFDDFLESLLKGTKILAKDTIGKFEDDAIKDAKAFIDKTEEDIKRWTKLLALEAITEEDFSDLIHAKKALAKIHFLRQKGVALTKIERFRTGFINLVIDTAFDIFL